MGIRISNQVSWLGRGVCKVSAPSQGLGLKCLGLGKRSAFKKTSNQLAKGPLHKLGILVGKKPIVMVFIFVQ